MGRGPGLVPRQTPQLSLSASLIPKTHTPTPQIHRALSPRNPTGHRDVLDSGSLSVTSGELVNDCLIGRAEGAGWVKSARGPAGAAKSPAGSCPGLIIALPGVRSPLGAAPNPSQTPQSSPAMPNRPPRKAGWAGWKWGLSGFISRIYQLGRA